MNQELGELGELGIGITGNISNSYLLIPNSTNS